MQQLQLPQAPLRLKRLADGTVKVYDAQRRMWLVLTPEEWVRQHFVHYLITELGYPASRVANEVSIRLNGTSRRCDTVVYSPELKPLAIVEYKSTTVAVTAQVFEQIARYNLVLRVPLLIVSNGLHHYASRIDEDGNMTFLREIPDWNQILSWSR